MAEAVFTTTEIIGALKETAPAVGFFRQFFADDPRFQHGTDEFILDRVSGVKGIATYVNREGEFVKVPSEGYKSNNYKPGYVKESMILTGSQLRDREPGSVPFVDGNFMPGDMLSEKTGAQFAKLENRIARLEELQASQVMTTGKVTVSGEGVNYEVDFGLEASHKITPAVLWSAATTAKPISDLKNAGRVIVSEAETLGSGFAAVMSVDSFEAFIATDQVKDSLKNNGFQTGKLDPKIVNALGATYEGFLLGFGEIWTYSREYVNSAGSTVNYMPTKTVVVFDLSTRLEAHYGVIENLNAAGMNGMRGKRFPQSIKSDKGHNIENTLESSPLMTGVQMNGVCVLTVLA